jgi:DNA mismatch endonuclease (patch repair protein)
MRRELKLLLPHGSFKDVAFSVSSRMRSIRHRGNKSTERRLRAILVRGGLKGWNVQPTDIFGKPDFVFRKHRITIFVDGCFWHGCKKCGHLPRKNSEFWRAKISRNQTRDKNTTIELEHLGFTVLRFWEHDLITSVECLRRIRAKLRQRSR